VWGFSANTGGGGYCGDSLATGPLLDYPANYTVAVADQCTGATGLQYLPARHSGGSNFVLCDGHAKWYQGAKVSAGFAQPLSDIGSTQANLEAACQYAINNPGYSSVSVPTESLGNTAGAPGCGDPAITFNTY
jgi:prepilin-type processing-associated H-X9-DG protein